MKGLMFWVILAFLSLGGWVANIVKLISDWDITSGMCIARILGVPIPIIGAILGYF